MSPLTPASAKPRVGHVLHSMVVAGAETLVHGMVRSMRDDYDFSIYLLDAVGPLGEELRDEGIPVTVLDRRPGVDWSLAHDLGRAMRRDGVSILHAHQYTPWFYGALAAMNGWRRPRVLFTEHGRHFPDHRRSKRVAFNKLLTPFTDGIVAVSAFIRDCLRDNEGLAEDRIRVLYNGIDPSRFEASPDRDRLRQEQGLGADDLVVGIAARFAPVKDHATLISAFAHVVRELPNAKLVLAGDGPLRQDLERQVKELSLESHVKFLGVRRDVPDLLKTWDVFCLSSLSEGTSVTLLEAMSSSLPAVVTAVGGNPEIVEDGRTGRLVPSRDPGSMGRAIVETLRDPEGASAMGRAGRKRVEDHFTFDAMVGRYDRLYEDLLRGART